MNLFTRDDYVKAIDSIVDRVDANDKAAAKSIAIQLAADFLFNVKRIADGLSPRIEIKERK